MNKTKERFCQLETSTRDKLNVSVKENKRFDLDQYMLTVENYNKLKCHAWFLYYYWSLLLNKKDA